MHDHNPGSPDQVGTEQIGAGFHYMVSNPPFGVDWKRQQAAVVAEIAAQKTLGGQGRFSAGLPRTSDGQLLFVQHIVSRMDPAGARAAIVLNGSPLFSGGAGSGESNIRRWLIEQDLVEAIIGLPTDLFPSTGIQTFIWVLTNRKSAGRRGTIQLIDASGEQFWQSMRRSVGSKRREIPDDAAAEIVRLCGETADSDFSKVLSSATLGYREIRVERPLRLNFQASQERIARLGEEKIYQKLSDDERWRIEIALTRLGDRLYRSRRDFETDLNEVLRAESVKIAAPARKAILSALSERDRESDAYMGADGKPEADPELRDHELLSLDQDVSDYMAREVLPHVHDAWVDETYRDEQDGQIGRVGYEINFNRLFYRYVPPRPLQEIEAELEALEMEIAGLMKGLRFSVAIG